MGGHCDYSTPGNRNLSMPLPMEKQKFVPSVFIPRTLVAVHNAVSTASVVMEAQQCVLCIVALHTLPLTIRNTQVFRQSARHFCPILTKFGISQQVIVLVPPPNIKFHEKSVQWDPRIHAIRQAICASHNFRLKRPKKILALTDDFVSISHR